MTSAVGALTCCLNGRDIRGLTLLKRKVLLRDLLIAADDDIRYSDEFEAAEKLLAVAEKIGLEGVVSKKLTRHTCPARIPAGSKSRRARGVRPIELFDKSKGSRSATEA